MFFLIVDAFGIAYVGDQHVHHLQKVLQEHYEITTDWEGEKFAGINIEWNYTMKHSERSHVTMKQQPPWDSGDIN